ncbi:MAG: amidophosphoribosyltransferase [Candidatus Altiarchaeota archaeon]
MSGLFGVILREDCSGKLFLGTDYQSHLGTQYGGMAVLNGRGRFHKRIHDIQQTQFKSKFYGDYKSMPGKAGIGVISDSNPQPLILESKFGTFALCTNGLVENKDELAQKLIEGGETFAEFSEDGVNTTELVAALINKGSSIVDGIRRMFDEIKGSTSLLLLNKDGIYAARDRFGRFPLVVAEGKDGWAVASESCAFPNLGFSTKKFIGPGEIALIKDNGMETIAGRDKKQKICSFLWIYTGFPASSYEGINAEIVRERCGKALAKDDDIKADMASGIPDSGTGHAIGYAIGSGLPFRRSMTKYTQGYGRSYTPPSQETRDQIALMKLIPNKDIIEGKSIVICEDSIVRGTQLKNYTIKKLFDNGAREVHIRVACPPLMYPCIFNLSTRTLEELAARKAIKALEGDNSKHVEEYQDQKSERHRKMVEWIRKDLDATTLKYQQLDDMIDAIGLPKERLCLYCWTGKDD